MVPTLQCGLLRSNFCLAILLFSVPSRLCKHLRKGLLNRKDWQVNRNGCSAFQSHAPGTCRPWRPVKRPQAPCMASGQTSEASPPLFGLGLLIGCRLLRRLQLLDGGLQARQRGLERSDLVVGGIEPLARIERVLVDELVQKIDVALKAARPFVQPGRLG